MGSNPVRGNLVSSDAMGGNFVGGNFGLSGVGAHVRLRYQSLLGRSAIADQRLLLDGHGKHLAKFLGFLS
jgi:hypothetical protein